MSHVRHVYDSTLPTFEFGFYLLAHWEEHFQSFSFEISSPYFKYVILTFSNNCKENQI